MTIEERVTMRRVFVLLFTIILLSTPVYAEVKVVGDQCYTGDVRLTSQVINLHVPAKVQEAYEAEGGFVWIKQLAQGTLTTPLTSSPYVIEVDPKVNWETTCWTVLRQFGSFLDKYQKVTSDSSKRSVIQSELWKYQSLCETLEYTIPECYSPETLFEIVFAAQADPTEITNAGDILVTCPQTVNIVTEAQNSITTTMSFSVTTYGVQTASSNNAPKTTTATPTKLPISFGD